MQPPFTTPDCLNVRPRCLIKGRERGGSRPGLVKAFPEDIGGEGRLLADLGGVVETASGSTQYWTDHFTGTALEPHWTLSPSYAAKPSVAGGLAYALGSRSVFQLRGVYCNSQEVGVAANRKFWLYIWPYMGEFDGTYIIDFGMDTDDTYGTAGDATYNGVRAILTLDNTGGYSGSLKRYAGGAIQSTVAFTSGTFSAPHFGVFEVVVYSTTRTVVNWRGTTILDQTAAVDPYGYFGFALEAGTKRTQVEMFRYQYTVAPTDEKFVRRMAVASAGGELWREIDMGHLAQLTTDLTLADRNLMAVEHHGKLYIADYDNERVSGDDGTIAADGVTLDAASVADWTDHDIDADDDVVVITNGTGDVTDGTYQISSIDAGDLTLAASAGGAGTCSYRVDRGPKYYNPVDDTLNLWVADSGKGQVPAGCSLITRYQDRIFLGGGITAAHQWYACRQGDANDWDYSLASEDTGAAISGATCDAGELGAPMTAMAAAGDDYLIFASMHEIWVLRGNPAASGMIDNVSRKVGIISRNAWCLTADGEFVFLSRDGLYMLPAGAPERSEPIPISRDKLPQEMIDLDVSTLEISLEYDVRARGIHILTAPK